jgi:hypothetical protein
VRALAEHLGVEVLTLDSPPPAQPGLRSEYQASPPRIILYRTAIAVGRACPRPPLAVRVQGDCPLTPRQVEDLHIAHELFHHLQATRRFAPLSLAQEEEAAHAFAEELLGLPFDPREIRSEQLAG